MKKFTRAGLYEFMKKELEGILPNTKILVIGGKGPILNYLTEIFPNCNFVTLDIASEHNPTYHLDLSGKNLLEHITDRFDFVIIMEVLEHIPNYLQALQNCQKLLVNCGKLIGSTPWVIPPHDLPHDYFRFSNYEIRRALEVSGFAEIYIESRGNLWDSIMALGLRGLKSDGVRGKYICVIFSLLSLVSPKAKRYFPPTDACIGYNWSGKKRFSEIHNSF